jgi:predicted PhzF superfamily epimerase YddE/YHI9
MNSGTSRTKTLVPVRDEAVLDSLDPDGGLIRAACDAVGSTGLYPYAVLGEREFTARQFPR